MCAAITCTCKSACVCLPWAIVHATKAFAIQGDRYDAQRAVIGAKLQDKLQDMQVSVTAYVRHHVCTNVLQSVEHFGGKQQLPSAVSCSVIW